MRCEMLPKARRNSLKRLAPSPSVETTNTVHLSPTRASTSLTARQSSGACKVPCKVPFRVPGMALVPSCAIFLVIYVASVIICNQDRACHEQTQDRHHH